MGIKQLFSLIEMNAPKSIRNVPLHLYASKAIAIDASKILYQFLIATSQGYQILGRVSDLTDKNGQPTGHLLGFISKSLQLVEAGIKPIWVFDGKPPVEKKREIERRRAIRTAAKELETDFRDSGNIIDQLKFHKRSVSISGTMSSDAHKMLALMGFSVIVAPAEAEAQCVQLLKEGKVSAVISEDMDCLAFGSLIMLKNFKKKTDKLIEISLETVLTELHLDYDQFIDLCILCGCDYCPHIGGLGPFNALKLIQQFSTIENVIKHLRKDNEEKRKHNQKRRYFIPPEDQFDFKETRHLFLNPEVLNDISFSSLSLPKEAELKTFLVEEKGFKLERVDNIVRRLSIAFYNKPQLSIENFFSRGKFKNRVPKGINKQNERSNKKIKTLCGPILIHEDKFSREIIDLT